MLTPEEQYLVSTGRVYFRDLSFDQLRRMQFDLETTGLDPSVDRIFMVAVRGADGVAETLEARGTDDAAEADLIRRLVARVQAIDPDVIENHNLHGFDLPFLDRRARRLRVPLALGRIGAPGLRQRAARRGMSSDKNARRQVRLIVAGRELIDTPTRFGDTTIRRGVPGHDLLWPHLARWSRSRVRCGDQIYTVYRTDPDRIVATPSATSTKPQVWRASWGAAFALAQMAPSLRASCRCGRGDRRIGPVARARLHAAGALPAHRAGDGTPHSGAGLQLFAAGAAHRVVKADVASLYPSLMRVYRIGPSTDTLGALLALVIDLSTAARGESVGGTGAAGVGGTSHARSDVRAMKLVVNSA
jgi:hypothetical protein